VNDSEEFPVVNIVASFWWGQGMGIVTDRAWKTGGSTLKEDGPEGKLGGIHFYFKRSVMVWAVKMLRFQVGPLYEVYVRS
jgi:hypothetical protein